MRRSLLILLSAAIVTAACTDGDGAGSIPTPGATETTRATTTTTTTTIDVTRACAVLGAETVEWLEDLVAELDRLALADVSDPAAWPPELIALDERGQELDRLVGELGCDPGTIQAGVLQEARLLEGEGMGARLLELLDRASG